MINPKSKILSVSKQCKLLNIHRSGYYYKPRIESSLNHYLIKIIDKEFFDKPFYGVKKMTRHLGHLLGIRLNEKRIRRLYRLMDLRVIYPKKSTSKPIKGHKKYPYLLKGLKIDQPNQVWAADITFIPMFRGFMYLVAIIDLFSRYVVAWSVSNTMSSKWCSEVLKEAIMLNGKPEIFNTDQGSQFTSIEFTSVLKRNQIQISMDGKGRAIDNIFIERLWRTVKTEYVYLNPPNGGLELYRGLNKYFKFYNNERLHQSLNYSTPLKIYQLKKITQNHSYF